jgi:LPXTG-site transpeptidase (sortase) family protein
MSRPLRAVLAALASALLVLGGTGGSLGYIGQTQIRVQLSGPSGVVKCDRSVSITATVRSTKSGKPIRNQAVSWRITQSQSRGDRLSAGRTVTNRQGKTSVSLSFGPVAGARKVRANVAGVSPSITVRCAGGLPKTSTRPPDDVAPETPSLLLPPPESSASSLPSPVAAVRIDRLGIALPVVEGDGVTVPEDAAAHYPGTAWPGEGSNTYLYAHAREDAFLGLWRARTGDLVEVDLADGSVAQYRIDRIEPLVAWDALEYLGPTTGEQLTLQTCLTYDETAPRFVVIASRISSA